VEDKQSVRQRRVDLQKILGEVDSMLVEARTGSDFGIDLDRIEILEDLQLALLARRPRPLPLHT
jgi:hypothetical protein